MAERKHPPGPADDARQHGELGERNLIASASTMPVARRLINVTKYPEDNEVPWFRSRVVCAKAATREKIDGARIGKSSRCKLLPPESPGGELITDASGEAHPDNYFVDGVFPPDRAHVG